MVPFKYLLSKAEDIMKMICSLSPSFNDNLVDLLLDCTKIIVNILNNPRIDIMDVENYFFYALKSIMKFISNASNKNIEALEGIISIIIGYNLKEYDPFSRDNSELDRSKRLKILIEDVFFNLFPALFGEEYSKERMKAIISAYELL